MRDGRLTRDDRNAYLESMTEEVAALVLRNNYLQSLAISLVERRGDKVGSELDRMMIRLENDGKLDRKVETLPDSAALAERYAAGKPLTRAEIGVLLSYAKIILFDDLAASSLSDDPYLERTLLSYFPRPMQGDFRGDIENHRLRREIISTMLANDAINRGGPSFVSSIVDATGALPADIVKCFVLARDGLELNALYDQVDALDAKVPGLLQNSLYAALGDTVRSVSHWAIGASAYMTPLDKAVTELQTASGQLRSLLPSLVSADLRRDNDRELATLQDAGVPQKLAHAIVSLPLTALIPELVQISRVCKRELTHVATQYFTVTETFRIGRIEAAARRVDTTDHYDALAVARNLDEISVARRTITMAALSRYGDEKDPIAAWVDNDKRRIGRVRAQILGLTESGDINVARLTVAAGMMADLARGDT
jgi:glutamate dehydrogenase